MNRTVAAPGKAILAGEYAVLHGAPAISVAVDRCVRARFGDGGQISPFVSAAVASAEKLFNRRFGPIVVDSQALYEHVGKLGLGSSAAVTAATVGLLFAEAGESLNDKRRLFELADEVHAAAQGVRGSGIDVATSVWGGVLRFQRRDGRATVTPVDLPDDVQLTFIFAGHSASTPDLIGRVKALSEAQPETHQAAIGRLISHAHAFATAIDDDDATALVRAAGAYHDAMQHLGEAAGCDIVTRAHAELAAIAHRHSGAAKPSGAGGGDLGVAFTIGPEATLKLRADVRAAGLHLLDIGAPAPGLRLDQ
jgi:phosphomevalonate kinase